MRKLTLFLSFLFLSGLFNTYAQVNQPLTPEQINNYSVQSKQLISYLEGTLNFIGDNNELPSDKDIIFNQSYLKIFESDKVQIEDDLDENRDIPLNKDVQAYLKDVDFFYKNVKFKFEIEKVDQIIADNDKIVFKLTLNRHLQGVTVDNDSINNNQLRFVEINLDPAQKELKIVSIYTTKIQEKEELRYWWNNMSSEWKNYFGKSVIVYDTLPFNKILWFSDTSIVINKSVYDVVNDTVNIFDDINTDPPLWADDSLLVTTDTIRYVISDTIVLNTGTVYSLLKTFRKSPKVDISNNLLISSIEPVSELTELIELNISNSLISDLEPIRNLKKLEILNCSGSSVVNLFPLRYINSLKELDVSYTMVDSFGVAVYLNKLTRVNMSHTSISEISNFAYLNSLAQLNISSTSITDISPLKNNQSISDLNISNTKVKQIGVLDSLIDIQHLNIDSTEINNLDPLASCLNLSMLKANNTNIYSLKPLNNHPNLRVIYCDNSQVKTKEASIFMENNPGCLVIYNSQELVKWWNNLSDEWKSVFMKSYELTKPITKEKLHTLLNQTHLTVAFNNNIKHIEPVSMLHNLVSIDISNTQISDISPISALNNLEALKINDTKVSSLEAASLLHNLKMVNISNTPINDITPLLNSADIETIYCDNSNIKTQSALSFKDKLPQSLVIYQTERLQLWWNGLEEPWQDIFINIAGLANNPSKEELQKLVDLQQLTIENKLSIKSLNPLHVFLRLNSLTVNSTGITGIGPILSLTRLQKINVSSNPITSLESVNKLINLEELIIRNTSVEDIEPISKVGSLKVLDIAGTRIKSLKYVNNLSNLKELYINNTRIKNVKPLFGLTKLTLLQCYNTSVKQSRIAEFKKLKPNVEVIYY